MNRPKALTLAVTAMTLATLGVLAAAAPQEEAVAKKAYVYTELQISAPFTKVPWQRINDDIKKLPGFVNKTWLSGVGNNSVGGFYVFDSIEHAQEFVTGHFPNEARGFGVALTTRIFDAEATEAASRDMNSMHWDGRLKSKPGAFVYTEVQLSALPFDEAAPWRALNPTLKQQPGFLAKTWTSGLHTGTPGGFYAFDTLENAQKFAIDYFPTEAKALNAAFYARVFDANVTEAASRDMGSPFYN